MISGDRLDVLAEGERDPVISGDRLDVRRRVLTWFLNLTVYVVCVYNYIYFVFQQ